MANPVFKTRNISPTRSVALRAEYKEKFAAFRESLAAARTARGMEGKFDAKAALKPHPNAEAKAEKAAKRKGQ